MEDDLVAVRVGEERHLADAGVECRAVERDALLLELGARGVDVGDAQREAGVVRGRSEERRVGKECRL